MKVLFLIGGLSIQDGGTAKEVIQLSEMLANEVGVIVTIACLTPKYASITVGEGVNYVEFNNFIPPSFTIVKDCLMLKRVIKEHDVVFSTGIWGPVDGLAFRIALMYKKPSFIRVCGMLEPYILKRHSFRKDLGLSLYVRKNLKKASGIIVNSKLEAENVLKQGIIRSKVHIIPNSVNVETIGLNKSEAKAALGLNREMKVLLYLGRIHPKKGLHLLLKAIGLLPRDQRAFSLVIAGEFSDENYKLEIERIVLEHGLEDLIVFSGLVDGLKKKQHFSAADCFILPSESEGLPNAVLEALAHGVPAIVTTGCNIPEIEEYKAGRVIDLPIGELEKALYWFLATQNSLETLSKNARNLVTTRFAPETFLKHYCSLIFQSTGY